jgi:hypothetical protein
MLLSQTFKHCGEMEHARRFRRELKLDNRLEGLHSYHLVTVCLVYGAGWKRTGSSLRSTL